MDGQPLSGMQGFRVLTEVPDRFYLPKSLPRDSLKEPMTPVGGEQTIWRSRTVFTREQRSRLEAEFTKDNYLRRPWKCELAVQLSLPESTIKSWFANRRMRDKKRRMATARPYAVYTDPAVSASILQPAAASASGLTAVAANYPYPPAYYPPRYAPYPTSLPRPTFALPDIEAPLLPPPQFCHLSHTHSETSVNPDRRDIDNYPTNCDGSSSCRCGIINCVTGRSAPTSLLPPVTTPHLPTHHLDTTTRTPTTTVELLKLTDQPRKLFRPYKNDLGEKD